MKKDRIKAGDPVIWNPKYRNYSWYNKNEKLHGKDFVFTVKKVIKSNYGGEEDVRLEREVLVYGELTTLVPISRLCKDMVTIRRIKIKKLKENLNVEEKTR